MSDPVKRMDIEDVLSSIRRLVADEPAPQPAAAPAASHAPDKLVLTSAFRVSAPVEAEENSDTQADQTPDGAEPRIATQPATPPDATAEQAPEPLDNAIDEAAASELLADAIAESQTFEFLTSGNVAAGADTAIEDVDPEEDMPEANAAPAGDPWDNVSLEDRIADLEAAISARDEDWEPDGSEMTPPREFETFDFDGVPTDEPQVRDDADDDISDDLDDESAEADETEGSGGLWDDEDPAVLDEDMLRQMISDIVREELQGALGERITRNVRKLVRREINRALASRELD